MTDWQDIRWFHAVAAAGSFSAAARAEGTTQATISRRIKALEGNLGAPLFLRTPGGITPTALAAALMGPAAEMAKAAATFARTHATQTAERRVIKITCGELIGSFLSRHLGRIQQGLGGTVVELQPTNAFVDIAAGEADLALRNKRPEKGALLARKLKSKSYGTFSVFGASAHYHDFAPSGVACLRKEPWIALTPGMKNLPSARWIAEHIGDAQIRFQMNSTALMLEATRQNRALALLPRFIGLAEGHLTEVYGPVDGLRFDMWIVRRQEGGDDPLLRRLISNVEAIFTDKTETAHD